MATMPTFTSGVCEIDDKSPGSTWQGPVRISIQSTLTYGEGVQGSVGIDGLLHLIR
jgi:hypothetical protein